MIIVLFGGLIYADTNGIWHDAKDIRGGIIASDEQNVTTDFTFMNPVTFNEILTANSNAIFNGNVGIGTSNPTTKLEVNGSNWFRGNSILGRGATSYNSLGYEIRISGLGNTPPLLIDQDGIARVVVNTNGNVGIGTSNSGTNRLEVVGGPIKASGGLIVETRSSIPPSPQTGQIWLRTDLG